MSHEANTSLIELAGEHIEYWTGTLRAEEMLADIERHDMESLQQHVLDSAKEMARNDYGEDEHKLIVDDLNGDDDGTQ